MRAFILAVALLFSAAPALAQVDVAPPTPEDVSVRVSADQNGAAIEATAGEAIAVELQSSPSTGASWRVASKPDFLDDAEIISGPVTVSARPVLGAPRWQVFVFPVNAAGEGALTLEKRGPGATGAVLETFTVTITAQ